MRARSLIIKYDKASFRLGEIDLDIPERKVTCVVGPNGSGKTTLLKGIGGLLDREGHVYIDGKSDVELTQSLARRISSYAGYFPQVDPLLNIKVLDFLLTSRYLGSDGFFESENDYRLVTEIAKRMGITHLLSRKLNELSGGELQKVLIALSMCKKPSYYLLDEPDAHVDMGFKPELARLIRSLSEEGTVILATHDFIFAQLTCDHYVVLNKGKVIFQGGKVELLNSADVISGAFGVKFRRTLIEGVGEILFPIYR